MGRALLTLAWIILLLLLVDSALHDPDVQPVVDRQVMRLGGTLDSLAGWLGAKRAEDSTGQPAELSQIAHQNRWLPSGPAETRYRSTTPIVAATRAGLAKSSLTGIRRILVTGLLPPQPYDYREGWRR